MSSEKRTEEKKSKKKKTFSLNKFLKSTAIILFLLIIIGSVMMLGTAYFWIKDAKPLNIDQLFSMNQTTYIVDENEKVIDKLHANENRTMISLDKIPKNLQNAFIAIEDKRFYNHVGIDPYRILGAVKEDVLTGKPAQGGSTLTQQLIKNVYLTRDKLIKRKVIEMYYSMQLERQFSKDQILEAYLNTISLGHNIAGVKEASLYYFGKEPADLTLAECAVIAGITKNPSAYSPYINFNNSMKRKDLILGEMLKQGKIDQSSYDAAINQKIVLNKVTKEVETTYFSDMIINDVMDALQNKLGYTKEEAELKLYNGGLKIIATINTDMQNKVEQVFQNPKLFPASKEDSYGILQPEAAAVIIDNDTGEIKAIIGGRSEKVRRGLNRATQSLRQPGSSIKPLSVYTPALDNGYSPGTVVDDSPITIGDYTPNNYDHRFHGYTTIRSAIQQSLNVVAVKTVLAIGVDKSADYLTKFHLSTIETKDKYRNDKNLASLALGGLTNGVKPLEMAAAYSVFPNKGIYTKPISFTKILDSNGNIIYENKPEKDRVISAQVAYMMVDIMKGVVNGGTGGAAALSRMPAAGKTGTTTKNVDAWFIGYTPYYTTAVWIGHDSPTPMSFTGGGYPARIWKDIMEDIHRNLPVKNFEVPEGLTSVQICIESGKRPSSLCALDPRGSTIRTEMFIPGTEPKTDDICNVHVSAEVDTSTNLLATPYCPSSLVKTKVYIDRKHETIVVAPDTPKPEDSIYEVPNSYCNVHTGTPESTVPPVPGPGIEVIPETQVQTTPTQ